MSCQKSVREWTKEREREREREEEMARDEN